MNETIEVVAVEEKPIDRAYNAKRAKRQTHLEVMGGHCLCGSQMNDMIVLGRLIPDSGKIHQNQEVYAIGGGALHIEGNNL